MENKPSTRAQITELENSSIKTEQLLKETAQLLERWQTQLPEWKKVQDFYYKGQYHTDLEAEQDGCYDDLPRGILSEDYIYNLDIELYDLAVQMVKTGATLLEKNF